MIHLHNSVLNEILNLAITLAACAALLGFWYVAISNVTPFAHTYTPTEIEHEKERAVRYAGIRRFSVRMDLIFFVWLILEGIFLIPYLFIHYGMV